MSFSFANISFTDILTHETLGIIMKYTTDFPRALSQAMNEGFRGGVSLVDEANHEICVGVSLVDGRRVKGEACESISWVSVPARGVHGSVKGVKHN